MNSAAPWATGSPFRIRVAALLGATLVKRIGQRAERRGHLNKPNAIGDRASLLGRFENPRGSKGGQMPGDDRKVHRAALGYFAHAAGPPTLCQTREQSKPCGVRECLERVGVEQPVDGPRDLGGLHGRARSSLA